MFGWLLGSRYDTTEDTTLLLLVVVAFLVL
jgi:hypothetical protein